MLGYDKGYIAPFLFLGTKNLGIRFPVEVGDIITFSRTGQKLSFEVNGQTYTSVSNLDITSDAVLKINGTPNSGGIIPDLLIAAQLDIAQG